LWDIKTSVFRNSWSMTRRSGYGCIGNKPVACRQL